MSKLWTLTKVLFKTNFLSGFSNSKKGKKRQFLSGFLLVFLLVFVIGSLGVPIIFSIDGILALAPLENILISLVLPVAGVTTILFSIFSVVSVFYLSKDSDHLLPMPISGKDILLSKFLVSLVNEYYILFMFILPCLVGIGVGIDAGLMYYLFTVIIFLLIPVIPSVVVTLIVLIFTRFTGVLKNKDLFMYISMFLILGFALVYNLVIQEFISVDLENVGTTFGVLENEVIPYLKMFFPFYNSASDSLINYDNLNGIFSLITFISLNFIFLMILHLVGDKLYLKTLIDGKSGSGKKEVSLENIKVKKSSSTRELLKKEWLVVKRTPIFMLNIVVIVFLMPVIFVGSILIGFNGEGLQTVLPSESFVEMYLENPFIYLIVLVACMAFSSFSVAASTSISREGSNAWFMKVIPVSPFKQINVKVLFASILDLIGVFIVIIVPIILFNIPLYYVFCVLVPVILLIFIINYFNILLDLKNPKIKWNEESIAVKQNLNGVISIFFTMAVGGIFGIVAYFFYKYAIDINVVILSGIISLVCGIILTFVVSLFKINENKLLDNVD